MLSDGADDHRRVTFLGFHVATTARNLSVRTWGNGQTYATSSQAIRNRAYVERYNLERAIQLVK